MKIQTLTISQYEDLDAKETRQNVPWQILNDDGSVAFEGNQSFPLTASVDEIKAFLAQCLQTHKEDVERAAETAEADAQKAQAIAVAEELTNFTLE